jgi:hypothetical protein
VDAWLLIAVGLKALAMWIVPLASPRPNHHKRVGQRLNDVVEWDKMIFIGIALLFIVVFLQSAIVFGIEWFID